MEVSLAQVAHTGIGKQVQTKIALIVLPMYQGSEWWGVIGEGSQRYEALPLGFMHIDEVKDIREGRRGDCTQVGRGSYVFRDSLS